MAEDIFKQWHGRALERILRGRLSCSRQRVFTLHLYLAAVFPPSWFDQLNVRLWPDYGDQPFDATVHSWYGTGDTLVTAHLEFDMNRLRRIVSDDEARRLGDFTPFYAIELSTDHFTHKLPNQSSLRRFRERPAASPDAPSDAFDEPFFTG